MFSWASETFAKLSETVAPPPTDGASRFVYCCQRGDEEGAIACVADIPGAGCIVNIPKGQVPLHLACLHSMAKLIRVLLSQPGASLDVLDAAGNTPLHCACLSNAPNTALTVVKMLIQECGFAYAVTTKNGHGQTPYDVAVLNAVRQYLLPLQLQQETQQAIDNGGVGLIPGADMGGLKIDRSHLPPPPMGGPAGNLGGPPASPYVTTPMRGNGGGGGGAGSGSYPEYSPGPPCAAGGVGGGYQNSGQQAYGHGGAAPMTPGAMAQGASPMPQPMHRSQSAPDGVPQPTQITSAPRPPPAAPSSGNSSQHAYSRNGSSSAAFYQPKAGESRNFVRPDGFHSSSSDKSLQQKYGHSSSAVNGAAAMPPPPSSSGSSYSNGGAGGPGGGQPGGQGGVHSSPGSLNNPYSGGLAALGGVNRSARNRYVNVAYDPVTGQQMHQPPPLQPAPPSGGYSSYGPPGAAGMGMPPASTNFNTFNPAAAQHQQQGQQQPASNPAAAVAPSPGQGYGYAPPPAAAASPAAPGGYGYAPPAAATVSSAAPGQGYGFNAPVAASPSASLSSFPPPPIPYHMQKSPVATFAAPPAATMVEQTPTEASPPPAVQPYSSPARSQPVASPRSAEQVFGAKPNLVPTPTRDMQQDPAAAMFAAPPAATEAPPPMEASPPPAVQSFASPDRSQPVASPRSAEQVFGAKPTVVSSPAKEMQQDPAAATFAAPPASTMEVSSPMEASPAQSFPRSHSIASPRSAEQVFGAKPTLVSTPETQHPDPTTPAPASGNWQPLQRSNTEDSAASASELFSKPPTASPTKLETEVAAATAENANSPAAALSSPVNQANGEETSSASAVASPMATDVFSKPVEAVDAFATAPPQAQPEPATVPRVQVHDATQSLLNGTSAASPRATDLFSKPQERAAAAADAFATAPPPQAQAQAAEPETTLPPAQEECGESAPGPELKNEVTDQPTGAVEEDEEDMMADIPLSPYRVQQEGDHQEEDPAATEPVPPSILPDTSLFSAIGMPPPPFTKKYTS